MTKYTKNGHLTDAFASFHLLQGCVTDVNYGNFCINIYSSSIPLMTGETLEMELSRSLSKNRRGSIRSRKRILVLLFIVFLATVVLITFIHATQNSANTGSVNQGIPQVNETGGSGVVPDVPNPAPEIPFGGSLLADCHLFHCIWFLCETGKSFRAKSKGDLKKQNEKKPGFRLLWRVAYDVNSCSI